MKLIVQSCKVAVIAIACVLLGVSLPSLESPAWDGAQADSVVSFGATGNGSSIDTAAVQRTIDARAAQGGGDVLFPAGTYLCGSLHMRSNITLRLRAGAIIRGIRDPAAYDPPEVLGFKNDSDTETSYFHHALIWGENLERAAIVGEGELDANFTRRKGPKPIAFKRCKFVRIAGITIRNAPNYNISLLGTDFVVIDGITILNGFADGIDPDSCRNVQISNSHVESEDDAIVLKSSFSLGYHRSCENVSVTNCFLSTACNCFKLGTESGGDFKHITVDNCILCGLAGTSAAGSGIAIESVDGANIAGVTACNISLFDVRSPVFMRLGNRGRDQAVHTPGSLRNVSISNIVAEGASEACLIAGVPDHPIEDVSLTEVRIALAGGGMLRPSGQPTPEKVNAYPDADMFGPLPADGVYARHVENLRLTNVEISVRPAFWRLVVPDDRVVNWTTNPPSHSIRSAPGPEMVFEDIHRLKVQGVDCWKMAGNSPAIRLSSVRQAELTSCTASEGSATFAEVLGYHTTGIHFTHCRMNGALVKYSAGATHNSVTLSP